MALGRMPTWRRAALAAVALLAAAGMALGLALATARPLTVAAAGPQVVAAMQVGGFPWLVPVAPRAAWALPLGDAAATLVPARLGTETGLFVLAAGSVRGLVLPSAAAGPLARPRAVASGRLGPDPVRQALAADLDGDGSDELLLLRGEATPPPPGRPGLSARVEVWQVQTDRILSVWQGLSAYYPWRLAAGDVDGDGPGEWAVGTWTRAVYDPRWAERPWVYRWKDGRPFALWLGSRLAHPFRDFALAPAIPGEPARLWAVEATRDDGETISLYRWNGFGFTLDYTAPQWQTVRSFTPLPALPGCAGLAAVVEPGPALVLLALPAAREGTLQQLAHRPLATGDPITWAAAPGRVWLTDGNRLRHFDTCPTPSPY